MIAGLNAVASVAAGGPASDVMGVGKTGLDASGLMAAGASDTAEAPFAELFSDAVSHVSQLERHAQKTVEGLMTGSGVDVHEAMIATQKASMAFELALAVRNKAVQAYQQVMNMQF